MLIKDSVIVITGATAGIGAAIARQLAQKGAKLILTGRRQDRLDALQQELNISDSHLLCIAGDLRDEGFCNQLVHQTVKQFNRIDVLINNAGLGHASQLIDIPSADFQTVWETNVYAVAWLSQAVASVMQNQSPEPHTGKRGQIINVSSIIEDRPLINQVIYSASKAAVNHYSRGLRMELSKSDITISILYPGLTHTEFHDAKLGQQTKPQFRKMGVTPDLVAKQVERAIFKQKREIYVTWYDCFFVQANRHFPLLTDQVFRYVANRKEAA